MRVAAALVLLVAADNVAGRVKQILGNLTLEEKVQFLYGQSSKDPGNKGNSGYTGYIVPVPRLGVPALTMNDGPQGFRAQLQYSGTSTDWPSNLNGGATWDKDLVEQWGAALGQEFYGKGANVILGPAMNIHRFPRNGRNFEYISGEDPVLGEEMVAPYVRGVQAQKVLACAKHYVFNSQEQNRGGPAAVSEVVEDRAARQIFYKPFDAAAAAGVGSVMCSYNRINGTYACEDPNTYAELDRAGFTGFVMSDWGATHSLHGSLHAGLAQEMPGGDPSPYYGGLLDAIKKGAEPESLVDSKVKAILTTMLANGLFESGMPQNAAGADVTSDAHRALARELVRSGAVLLQNDGALPLAKGAKVAVVNCDTENGLHGGGSGQVKAKKSTTVLAGLQAAGVTVAGTTVEAAKGADAAVVCFSSYSSEGMDRKTLALDGEDELAQVAAVNGKTIGIALTPGAFTISLGKVNALVASVFPGEAAGLGLADVLTGAVSFSGKLPFTVPADANHPPFSAEQYPGVQKGKDPYKTSTFTEGLQVGYRWFHANKVAPLFPFGHGLSYTTFSFAGLSACADGVSVTVTNTGKATGREVVQVYATFADPEEPPAQLVGFAKTPSLAPGASATVKVAIPASRLQQFVRGAWERQPGPVDIFVGSSSADRKLTGQLPAAAAQVYV